MSASLSPVQIPSAPATPLAPHERSPRSPRKWIIAALVVLVAALAVYRALTKPTPATAPVFVVKTAKVTVGNLENTTRLTGQTSARDFANIVAPVMRGPDSRGDLVLMKLAPSGSLVKKGEVVAQIDAQPIQDHIDDLNDTIEAATADINKRRAEQGVEWETLQQTLRVAKSQYDKAKLDAGAAEVKTDVERQLLQLSLDEAEAAYKQQLADLKSKKAGQEAELRILELTKERHVRHRDRHALDLKRFTINAPISGLVVMSPTFRNGEMGQIQLGDRIFPGQGFMKIVDPQTMQVEASMNQSESSELRIGKPARIHLDAFPGVELTGKVYSLGALAVGGWRQNYFIRTIPVRVSIDHYDSKLIPDLSASADVVLDRAENKPIVPLSAIHLEGGAKYAYVKRADGFEKRKVELGLSNDTHAVVASGLEPGNEVRIN